MHISSWANLQKYNKKKRKEPKIKHDCEAAFENPHSDQFFSKINNNQYYSFAINRIPNVFTRSITFVISITKNLYFGLLNRHRINGKYFIAKSVFKDLYLFPALCKLLQT